MARKSRKAVNQVILPAAPSEKIYRAGRESARQIRLAIKFNC